MVIGKRGIKEIVDEGAMLANVSKRYLFTKRLLDIIIALAGLLILSPLFIITSAAILIDSAGPIINRQARYGLKGKVFRTYRFRTVMCKNVHRRKLCGIRIGWRMMKGSMKSDPMETRVGRVIGGTGIDRLPQLLNVLKGDMSLVGPRAPLTTEVNKYDTWHNLRFSVRPGITGLWQISGKSNNDFENMVRLDLKYIRERGLKYDFKILVKTLFIVLRSWGRSVKKRVKN